MLNDIKSKADHDQCSHSSRIKGYENIKERVLPLMWKSGEASMGEDRSAGPGKLGR